MTINRPPHTQSRIDSFMESITNTVIGFTISLVTWAIVSRAYGIPMTWAMNLKVTAWFTVVSIIRQYVLRRLFDGRTVWQAIKDTFGRKETPLPECFGDFHGGNLAAERCCNDCKHNWQCL